MHPLRNLLHLKTKMEKISTLGKLLFKKGTQGNALVEAKTQATSLQVTCIELKDSK